jgi:phospholipase C
MSVPDPDPGEQWLDINMQLFGTSGVPSPIPTPGMTGFVHNYMSQTPPDSRSADTVMHYYLPQQVPVISDLARTSRFVTVGMHRPPARDGQIDFFVHTGTANGYENNSPFRFLYEMPTIFKRFKDKKIPNGWKIYFHDMAQSATLSELWRYPDHFQPFDQFKEDAAKGPGGLPCYSFIEPRYYVPDGGLPNDQHPPPIVTLGEQLIAEVYNCLRAGPAWKNTLFIITYDEHGGCYDHVPPPSVPPGPNASAPFNFDRYGVRVPTVIVSPYIPRGTVLKPLSSVPFDHTSIIASLRKRFNLGPPLTERDKHAPDLEHALTLNSPDNDGPDSIGALAYQPSPEVLAAARKMPLNGMQRNLLELAHILPQDQQGVDLLASLESHIENLRRSYVPSIDTDISMQDAGAAVQNRVCNFLNLGRKKTA